MAKKKSKTKSKTKGKTLPLHGKQQAKAKVEPGAVPPPPSQRNVVIDESKNTSVAVDVLDMMDEKVNNGNS